MPTIHVIGLGPGDLSGLPMGAYQRLQSGLPVYLRTAIHPVVDELRKQGLEFVAFDSYYEQGQSFEDVYQQIAQELLQRASTEGDLVYAVPGHPLMAEQSVQNLLAHPGEIEIVIGPGQSFFDPVCSVLKIDPIGGLSLLDGTMLRQEQLQPSQQLLIAQVFHQSIASDVKLALMEVYPDDFPVTVIRAAGVQGQERIEKIPLYELDRLPWVDHLTTVYVPATDSDVIQARDPWFVARLVERLRDVDGCPWDREQTHESLRPYVVEEAYEVVQAIDNGDPEELAAELGDLLLQILLHSQIAMEHGDFSLRDVFASLSAKLIRRHPHVFGDVRANTVAEAETAWQNVKQSETSQAGDSSVLAKVKRAGPSWKLAHALQVAAAEVGFDWANPTDVMDKLREEVQELAETLSGRDALRMEDELGDVLFSCVNLARWLNIDVDESLKRANAKFERRFLAVEQSIVKQGKRFADLTAQELDTEWRKAKDLLEI